ncbi:MAG TPA: phage major tail tube protein [Chroococcidiopsis sp.]
MPTTRKFEEAVVWLNGNSLAGQIAELELPDIEWDLVDHETISGIGMPQYPTKLKELECTLNWASYSPELAAAAANPFKAAQLQIRSNYGENTAAGKVGDRLLRIDLTGRFVKNGAGKLKAGEMERESMMVVTYYREVYEGIEQLAVDVTLPSYRVLGQDMLAQRRINLGG